MGPDARRNRCTFHLRLKHLKKTAVDVKTGCIMEARDRLAFTKITYCLVLREITSPWSNPRPRCKKIFAPICQPAQSQTFPLRGSTDQVSVGWEIDKDYLSHCTNSGDVSCDREELFTCSIINSGVQYWIWPFFLFIISSEIWDWTSKFRLPTWRQQVRSSVMNAQNRNSCRWNVVHIQDSIWVP